MPGSTDPNDTSIHEVERLGIQNQVIDLAERKADALGKFSYTAFLSLALLNVLGVIGSLTSAFFSLPALIFSKLFESIITGLKYAHERNWTLAKGLSVLVSSALMCCAMLIIMISMTTPGAAAVVASLATLATVFFAIDTVFHLGSSVSNLYKAFMAPRNSNERKAYLQSAFKHTVNLAISLGILALLTVSLSPPVMIGIMGAVAATSLLYIGWSLIPNSWREGIKGFFGLKQSDESLKIIPSPSASLRTSKTTMDIKQEKTHYGNFFKRAYRRDVVKHYLLDGQTELAKNYLKDQIAAFKAKYVNQFPNGQYPAKQQAKLEALNDAELLLDKGAQDIGKYPIEDILDRHDLAAQSAFADISDTVDILEAVKCFLINTKDITATPDPILLCNSRELQRP